MSVSFRGQHRRRPGNPDRWKREMTVTVAVLVALVALCWLTATTLGFVIQRQDRSVDHDLPSMVLGFATRRLPTDRSDWGRALAAELASIDGRAARWSFMLGGVWTAVVGRLAGRRDRLSLSVSLGAAAVCAGLVVASIAVYPRLLVTPRMPAFLVVAAIVLGCYAIAAVVEARSTAQTVVGVAATRRWAVLTGLVVGLVWTMFASGWLDLHGWLLVAAAVLPAVLGAASAHHRGGIRVGVGSVRPMALAAGLSAFTMSTLEAFATANGPYDTNQLDESAARGYASVATYRMGEGLATSLLLLLAIPLCTVLFGVVGVIIGQIRRPSTP